jgi:hypothetical protein
MGGSTIDVVEGDVEVAGRVVVKPWGPREVVLRDVEVVELPLVRLCLLLQSLQTLPREHLFVGDALDAE